MKITEAPEAGVGHIAWRARSPQALERRVAAIEAAGLGQGWSDGDAGHDLNQANLAVFLDAVPGVLEVSIGHALIAEALHAGLDAVVRRYRALVDAA